MAAALQHRYEEPTAGQAVEAARAEVRRLSAGLSRSLLAVPPPVVRSIAARAVAAEDMVARRVARVGERPALDDGAADAAREAEAAYRAAQVTHRQVNDDRHRLLAWGNAAGVCALAVAGGLTLAGAGPMSSPVAAAAIGSAGGPLMAMLIAADRCSGATRRVNRARVQWAEALAATGLATMGALAARRLAVEGWEQLRREAEAARATAAPHLRAWHRLAGPGVAPADAEALLARADALRSAQLRLLAALLDLRRQAPAPAPAAALHLQPPPEPEPVATAAPAPAPAIADLGERGRRSKRDDAFSRIRGRKLRLWGPPAPAGADPRPGAKRGRRRR